MKLLEYQDSGGVPLRDQLCTVDNPCFGRGFYHLDVSNPVKWRLSSKLLRTWAHRIRLSARDRNLSLSGLEEGQVIHLCNSDGRVESGYKVQLAVNRLAEEIQGHVILLGKSDVEINDTLLEPFNGCRVKIFGNNLNSDAPIAGYFPMGRDFRGNLYHDMRPQVNKDKLVYCNFSLNTHPVRSKLWQSVKGISYVYSEHMGEYCKYALTHEAFYTQLSKSKFCLAPRGNAIETFRMWDSLYLGTVPIVVHEAKFHDELEDLPILFIDDYSDLADMSEVWLNQKYDEFLQRDWNYDKLKVGFWLARIKSVAEDLIPD